MTLELTPAKVVVLAVSLATTAEVDGLNTLVRQHPEILRRELVLRILLTHLPEATRSHRYVPLIEQLCNGELVASIAESSQSQEQELDTSAVANLSEEHAIKLARKLRLLPLALPHAPVDTRNDPVIQFLVQRVYRVDEVAGLSQIPSLISPFVTRSHDLQPWAISTLLPLFRRNLVYYPQTERQCNLARFESLSGPSAVAYLLSETGTRKDRLYLVGRDLRGLIGPWLLRETNSISQDRDTTSESDSNPSVGRSRKLGWKAVAEWLLLQAMQDWQVAEQAVLQWDGPEDMDTGEWACPQQPESLLSDYVRTMLASIYLASETSLDALQNIYRILEKAMKLLGQVDAPCPDLQHAAAELAPATEGPSIQEIAIPRNASYIRNDLLSDLNPLTAPTTATVHFLRHSVLSAFLLSKSGLPWSVKKAADLVLLRDQREQKVEVTKFLHNISARGSKNSDLDWSRARAELLWLWNWGSCDRDPAPNAPALGVFGMLSRELLETEMLQALLSNTRYSLAQSIYEQGPDKPLSDAILRSTIFAAAMNAYDNASNPNRTKGGLKKCDDIIHSFPRTIDKSLPEAIRLDSLLQATHKIGEYRLVLRQGEPFTPVILKVHSDPVSIIEKLLEQNPGSYTRITELLEIGANMIKAGLTSRRDRAGDKGEVDQANRLLLVEKRVAAMCIQAALREDDFETAYSYVVSRLTSGSPGLESTHGQPDLNPTEDDWSWRAALEAGQYNRTGKTLRPTHLGTASGNPEIRHLEQRIDCLAAALRIAPASQLHQILKVYRRSEEQLDSAWAEESAREDAWDTAGDLTTPKVPGGFGVAGPRARAEHSTAPAASRATEDAPMSLFDLSRAATRAASKNLSALSPLQGLGSIKATGDETTSTDGQRVRKRDQLREAAVGTLVSGVGWLVGAPSADRGKETS